MKQKATQADSGTARSASLVDALQALAAEMSKASTELEAEEGLRRLHQIQGEYLDRSGPAGAAAETRRNAEALVRWLEARLEQLRQQLARKRRIQEGEVMEQIARQREADSPALLPSELIDAIVRRTDTPDKQAPAPAAGADSPDRSSGEPRKPRKKKDAKPAEEAREAKAGPPTPTAPAESPAGTPRPEEPSDRASVSAGIRADPPAPAAKPAERSEWTKYQRLAAHLAASVQEDPRFFEKLRAAAKRNRAKPRAAPGQPAPEVHFRAVHALNQRLVNLELHAKAIARAAERLEPVTPLMKTAARELKGFLQDYRSARETHARLSGEYDRLFGGYAEQLAAMKPVKGQTILELCRNERQPKPGEAAEDAPRREPEVPQLVLRREDD